MEKNGKLQLATGLTFVALGWAIIAILLDVIKVVNTPILSVYKERYFSSAYLFYQTGIVIPCIMLSLIKSVKRYISSSNNINKLDLKTTNKESKSSKGVIYMLIVFTSPLSALVCNGFSFYNLGYFGYIFIIPAHILAINVFTSAKKRESSEIKKQREIEDVNNEQKEKNATNYSSAKNTYIQSSSTPQIKKPLHYIDAEDCEKSSSDYSKSKKRESREYRWLAQEINDRNLLLRNDTLARKMNDSISAINALWDSHSILYEGYERAEYRSKLYLLAITPQLFLKNYYFFKSGDRDDIRDNIYTERPFPVLDTLINMGLFIFESNNDFLVLKVIIDSDEEEYQKLKPRAQYILNEEALKLKKQLGKL